MIVENLLRLTSPTVCPLPQPLATVWDVGPAAVVARQQRRPQRLLCQEEQPWDRIPSSAPIKPRGVRLLMGRSGEEMPQTPASSPSTATPVRSLTAIQLI